MRKKNRFTITEDHLKLAKAMWVSWEYCETGAPCIDPKRPYGNSDVSTDIGEILGHYTFEEAQERFEDGMPEELDEKYMKLHAEMETVLQICLRNLAFETGTYEEVDYSDWRRVED